MLNFNFGPQLAIHDNLKSDLNIHVRGANVCQGLLREMKDLLRLAKEDVSSVSAITLANPSALSSRRSAF